LSKRDFLAKWIEYLLAAAQRHGGQSQIRLHCLEFLIMNF